MTPDVVESVATTSSVEYAGLLRRFVAFAIDLMVAGLVEDNRSPETLRNSNTEDANE